MTIWKQYENSQREEYIKFLQVYGALSNLFRQKHGDMIPYLDSKFQETVYARVFESKNVDIGNTPHDILSIFGKDRIGIGLKTWMNTKQSFQKVMQIKAMRNEVQMLLEYKNEENIAYRLSEIKNEKMIRDYKRLGLSNDKNIYHYVTRDENKLVIQETAYPLIELNKLRDFRFNRQKGRITNFEWSDGLKDYKFTFSDNTFYMKFGSERSDTTLLDQFRVDIIDDPFNFLITSYFDMQNKNFQILKPNVTEVYLPLYSYKNKEVKAKSGLNAWNSLPKSKNSSERPLNEIYIPIPREFHKKNPDFFVANIFEYEKTHKAVEFTLILPNGDELPASVRQSGMKGLQSGSKNRRKKDGTKYGQGDLGQWLLIDVLGLRERTLVTREWLKERGTDSVKLWYQNNDKNRIYIDFAEYGSFEKFMEGEILN
ncbi:restriction endonuclease PLD domain-containing protein [Pseudolactococcus raffinolactis]|uniref:restriction endonuclease PLD domain-containing protein n=1 Tax=Pseudolactococcus raffinolactis TaxID=1366 RepID=UPI001108E370|nr:restriction endonuclease PLD domain-containing protein [Lactococcus raffinolactis]TLQ14019.1 NgoFVII family restriction endonuclease [Lactococcus raffinolactis]